MRTFQEHLEHNKFNENLANFLARTKSVNFFCNEILEMTNAGIISKELLIGLVNEIVAQGQPPAPPQGQAPIAPPAPQGQAPIAPPAPQGQAPAPAPQAQQAQTPNTQSQDVAYEAIVQLQKELVPKGITPPMFKAALDKIIKQVQLPQPNANQQTQPTQ